MGLGLTQFLVENISLPAEVEAALDKRSSMSVLGNLDQYTKFQSAEAIRDAAQNPGGAAGAGIGFGAGIALGNQMAGAMVGGAHANPVTSTTMAPPLPLQVTYFAALGGLQAGPFDMATLSAKIRGGEITKATLLWKSGMANWTAADAVAEVAPLFNAVPPPLPL